ncbi:MAG TPA: hypothetical protein VGL28_03610, partial [Steroidobacteraceae bacterium]
MRPHRTPGLLLAAVLCWTPLASHGFEWGACVHLALGRGNADQILGALQRGGFSSFRDDVYWGPMETSRGQLDFPQQYRQLDRAVTVLAQAGGTPLLILDYGNDFYDGGGQVTSAAGIEAFERYVGFVVSHFGNRVNQYEVWNEWNTGFGSKPPRTHGDPQDYARLLARTYATIKAINPNARVIGGAVAGGDRAWSRAFFSAGGLRSLDAFSVHSYTLFHAHSNPEVAFRILDALRGDMQKSEPGREIPVLVTEIGWPTNQGRLGVSESVAAAYLVRFLALASARPWIAGIWWYDLIDDGGDVRASEQQFGLLKSATPPVAKAAYAAASEAGPLFATSTRVHSFALPGGGYAITGRTRQHDWLVGWQLEPAV